MNTPISIRTQSRFHEGSGLRSLRDSDSLLRAWKKGGATGQALAELSNAVGHIEWRLNNLRRRSSDSGIYAGSNFYPFKIYPSPNPQPTWGGWSDQGNEIGSYAAADTWTFFRVRAGAIGTVSVVGTDGDGVAAHPSYDTEVSPNVDPDNTGVPDFSGEDDPTVDNFGDIDFAVTSGEQWYVWIDNSDPGAPEINAANSAPTEHWPGSDYILIGTIDCTDDTNKVSVIRQYRRQDIPLAYGCVDGTTTDVPL